VFRALDSAEVRYVVVGGLAAALHGRARQTVDLDMVMVIDLAPAAAERAIDVLLALGFVPRLPVDARQFADVRRRWVEERDLQVCSLHDPADPLREVDLFASMPLPFDDLVADGTVIVVDGVEVRVASLAHLIAMKESSACRRVPSHRHPRSSASVG